MHQIAKEKKTNCLIDKMFPRLLKDVTGIALY